VVAITGGYITIGAVVFDYSRWVANWVVCLVLVMLATHLLPLASGKPRPSIVANAEGNLILGWVVTVIPRVGITVPF
jgi:hypothetical protein